MTDRLIRAARAVNPDLNVEELADAVWLLGVLYPGGHEPGTPPAVDTEPSPEPTPRPPTATPAVSPLPPAAERLEASLPEPAAEWYLPSRDRLLEEPTRVAMRSPGAAALPGTLAMARALRPLRRRMPSRTAVVVDEELTAQQAADGDLWVPAIRPAPDRWLDLALVFDDSASMVIWRRTCVELRELLERLGAFRDVRVWRCDTDVRGPDKPLTLRPAASTDTAGRDVRELVDPTRRRAVLVVSDCVGQAWQTGQMARALRTWGAAGPVAIVQTLPQRLWEQCAPQFVPVQLGARHRGAANTELEVMGPDVPDGAVPVPVLELAARWFAPWASLVSRTGPEWLAGTVVFAEDTARPAAAPPPTGAGPDELLADYRSFASTEAVRLATCLAAAPLSLPVIRLVQQAMLPDSRPSVLAEVFLGGLLRRRPPKIGRDLNPDEVEYDFVSGVRDRLLAALSRQDKLSVLRRVSDYVTARLGSPMDFPAFLAAREGVAAVLEHDPPFARVALRVLEDLGGRYREAAGLLQRRLHTVQLEPVVDEPSPPAGVETITTSPDIPDKSGQAAAPSDSVENHAAELTQPGDTVVTSPPSTEAVPVSLADTPTRPAEVAGQPAVFGRVPFRNPHFTGRESMLGQLHAALRRGTSQMALLPHALYGLGGVGKTQLAIEYAYRYATQYDLVWWVPAESPTTVRQSLAELATAMNVGSGDVSQAVANVLGALRTGRPFRRWLLVLDNADDPAEFREILPVPVGHVLVTSRNPQWADVAEQLEVNVFSRNESKQLLQRRGRGISAEEAEELAEKLGDLPLALDQAAAWQSETGMPARELARLLDERIHVLLSERPSSTYPATVMATFELAFSRLREQAPGAAQLLRMCAFFGAEPIAVSLLWEGRRATLSQPVSQVLRDDIALRRAIRDIHRYGLAKVDPSRDQIEVHRLVQAVLREQMSPEERETIRDAVHGILGLANPGDPENPNTWPRHAELLPHVTPSGLVDAKAEDPLRTVLDQMVYRFARGDYVRSRSLGETAVDRWRQRDTLGPDHELTLLAQRSLARAMREVGEREQARTLMQETFERMREVFGPDHEHTLDTASSVGLQLRLQGEFDAAKSLDEDTLARHRRVFSDDHPATMRMMNNLAVNLRLLGDHAGALELDTETYRLQTDLLGANHPSTLISLTNVARDHFDGGRYREALEMVTEGLPRMRSVVGEEGLVTLMAKRVEVMVRRRLGEHLRARELAEELYHTVQRIYRPDHERMLSAMMTFANALLAVGELAQSRSLAEQALQRYRGTFGQRHPFTLAAALNLAIILRACEEFQAARELDEATLAVLRETLGDDHPYALAALLGLGNDEAIAHEHERARALSEEVYNRSRRIRGENHPATLACALNYSLDLRATDRGAAQSLFETVLIAMRDRLGDGHSDYRAALEGRRAERDIEVGAV